MQDVDAAGPDLIDGDQILAAGPDLIDGDQILAANSKGLSDLQANADQEVVLDQVCG